MAEANDPFIPDEGGAQAQGGDRPDDGGDDESTMIPPPGRGSRRASLATSRASTDVGYDFGVTQTTKTAGWLDIDPARLNPFEAVVINNLAVLANEIDELKRFNMANRGLQRMGKEEKRMGKEEIAKRRESLEIANASEMNELATEHADWFLLRLQDHVDAGGRSISTMTSNVPIQATKFLDIVKAHLSEEGQEGDEDNYSSLLPYATIDNLSKADGESLFMQVAKLKLKVDRDAKKARESAVSQGSGSRKKATSAGKGKATATSTAGTSGRRKSQRIIESQSQSSDLEFHSDENSRAAVRAHREGLRQQEALNISSSPSRRGPGSSPPV